VTNRLGAVILLACTGLVAHSTTAQTDPNAGIPPFATVSGSPFDALDLATSNFLVSIPLRSKNGKIPFTAKVVGQAHVFFIPAANSWGINFATFPVVVTGQMYWGQSYYSYMTCGSDQNDYIYNNFVAVDETGASHPFATEPQLGPFVDQDGCYAVPGPMTTVDGSGYTLVLSRANRVISGVVYDASGNYLTTTFGPQNNPIVNTVKDPDGTAWSSSDSYNSNTQIYTTTYTDTLGQTALTQTSSPGGPTASENYQDMANKTVGYTFSYSSIPYGSNFGCTNNIGKVWEYGNGSPGSFLTGITTPDGGKYTIGYEATHGKTGWTTGRIASITLPTGGSITYQYSGGTNGINCYTGVVPQITRTINDANGNSSVWIYQNNQPLNSYLTGPYTVNVTEPANNLTVYTFDNSYYGFQTQRQSYQGSGGAPLLTTVTCYNGTFTNCTTSNAGPRAAQVTQTDVFTYLNGSSTASLVETKYDTYGNVAEVKKYDFGAATTYPPSAAPSGSPLSDTTISYGSWSGTSCGSFSNYIRNRPCVATTINSSGAQISQTRYTYNSEGHPTQTARWVSGTQYLTSTALYNTNGTLQYTKDVNGAQTNFTFGACNGLLLTSVSLPVNNLSYSQTWDPSCTGGVLASSTDVNGNQTTYSYVNQTTGTADPYWRVLSVTNPDGGVTTNTYNLTSSPPNIQASHSIDSGGDAATEQTNLDGLGRPIEHQTTSDPSGINYVDTAYDVMGRIYSVSNPYRTKTDYTYGVKHYAYDALSRIKQITNADSTSRSFTYTNRAVEVTNERNISEIQQYDSLGRLISVCTGINATKQANGATVSACQQDIAANGFLASYSYDTSGNSFIVNYTGQSRTYLFDGLNRLTSETNPETGTTTPTTYSYDVVTQGDLYQRVKLAPNQTGSATTTTTYTFDALHRLTGVSYSGGYPTPSATFTYDVNDPTWNVSGLTNLKGHLVSAWVGSNISTLFDYDQMGRTVDVWQCTPHTSCNTTGSVHSFGKYDYVGDSTFVRVGTNDPVSYAYDNTPHLIHVNDPDNSEFAYMFNILYNGLELPRNQNMGDGNKITLQYDQRGGLTSKSVVNGSATTYNLGVGYTLDHNVNSVSDSVNGSWTYVYSAAFPDRLSSSTCSVTAPAVCPNSQTSESHSYSYDQFGNRWGQTAPKGGPSFAYVFNANNQITNGGVVYDAAGNMIADENQNTYTYDDENRLVTVGGQNYSIGYSLDAFGRRVEITNPSAYKDWFYDVLGRMSYQGGTQGTFNRVYAGNDLIATTDTNGTHYYYGDQVGTLRMNTNSSGTATNTCTSLPFGDFSFCTNALGDRVGFTGQWNDPDGLTSFPARAYSTVEGRWASTDPAGLGAVGPDIVQSWNRYAYVTNNPLSLTDPDGRGGPGSPCGPMQYGISGCNTSGNFPCLVCGLSSWDSLSEVSVVVGYTSSTAIDPNTGQIISASYTPVFDTAVLDTFIPANNYPTISALPPQPNQPPLKPGCTKAGLLAGLKAAASDFFTPPGADPRGDVGDKLRDKDVQRAAVGTLYVVANSARYVAPAIDVAADLIPVAGEVLLVIQAGHALYEGGKAYKESIDQCYDTP